MIPAELRIGNYVNVPDKEYEKIWEITEDSMNNIIWPVVYPIPLTLGILEKCGFGWLTVSGNKRLVMGFKGIFFGYYETGVWLYDTNERAISQVQYLHQLQNLYFALTEKELDIKL